MWSVRIGEKIGQRPGKPEKWNEIESACIAVPIGQRWSVETPDGGTVAAPQDHARLGGVVLLKLVAGVR